MKAEYANIDSFGWAFAAEIAKRNGDEAGRKACERELVKAIEREGAEKRAFAYRLTHSA